MGGSEALAASVSLIPWYEALGELETVTFKWEPKSSEAAARASMLWISCDALVGTNEAVGARLGLVCEVFGLLNLLARVDIGLWKTKMRELWPTFVNWEYFELDETPLEIPTLGLACRYGINSEPTALDHFKSVKPISSDYEALRSRLEAMLDGDGSSDASVPLRVELKCVGLSIHNSNVLLEDTLKMVNEKRPRKNSSRFTRLSSAPSYDLIAVCLSATACVAIDSEGLGNLRKIADCGIELGNLPPLRIFKVVARRVEVMKDLRSLLLAQDASEPRVRTVAIADQFAHYLIPTILSAVQGSRTVERVEINLSDDWDRTDLQELLGQRPPRSNLLLEWQQIAYSLFSKHANHNVQTLVLKVSDLQIQEVDAVRKIVEAENPLAALEGVACAASAGQVTSISASCFWLEDPDFPQPVELRNGALMTKFLQQMQFNSSKPQDARVIEAPDGSNPSKPWTVWLPGHGKAWVDKEDVQSTQFLGTPRADQLHRPSFPRIDIVELSDQSADAVIDLLEIIGHGTKRIHCRLDIAPSLIDGWCRHLLSVCPKLEHLDLGGGSVESLMLFADAAVAGRCRLRELHNASVSASDDEHILSFLKALQDPNHPLTKQLEFLDIKLEMVPATTSSVVDALLRMLQHNRRLRKVHVGYHTQHQRDSDQVMKQYAYGLNCGLKPHDSVFVRVAPLEIQKKVALLSALDSAVDGDTNTDRSVLARLDSSLIAIVFEFAAQGRARDERVSFTYDFPNEESEPEEESESEEEPEIEEESEIEVGSESEIESAIEVEEESESDEESEIESEEEATSYQEIVIEGRPDSEGFTALV